MAMQKCKGRDVESLLIHKKIPPPQCCDRGAVCLNLISFVILQADPLLFLHVQGDLIDDFPSRCGFIGFRN
ncbi:hypothetical protein H206_01620 [Candidatus Electrothrix aarhusensis]|uniref:Uncharacterized protein n=1 Tax=Candidatus Electrothrix aarhusensis TaxID=1859131 RepID=A0A444IUW4_9BACT|nr:hypothetical protein H206_01620 [Candidatus Electrothrix aarhusensis]